jgi:2-octaprenyl-6-methoxyphenol hydroxylase
MKHEFSIYGSGISAKLISIILARDGFSVCLISDKDRGKEISNTNLVTFLSKGSLNYLSLIFPSTKIFNEDMGIKKIECQLESMTSKKNQLISFNKGKSESLGKIVLNKDIDKYLDKEISQLSNINIINSHQPSKIENTKNGVKLKLLNGDEIDTDLFILSSTRNNIVNQIKISFLKKNLEQIALSLSIKGDIKNSNCAFQKFTNDGPLALLPYSEDEASVVWSLKNNSEILSKDNKQLAKILNNHLSEYINSIKIISTEKHKLKFAYAKNLFYKNTVLIGNVAHNIHPIAGQGLNLSIKNIVLFVKLINKYKSLGYKLNDQLILEEFAMKRKLDNAAYSFGTFSLNGILSSNSNFINFSTRKGLGLINKSDYIKNVLIENATGRNFYKSF